MKFFGMGGFELVIILVVILLIFGPKNLPKLGNALGKTVSNLRSGMNEGKKKDKGEEEKSGEGDDSEASATAELEGDVMVVEEEAPEEGADDHGQDEEGAGSMAGEFKPAEGVEGAEGEGPTPEATPDTPDEAQAAAPKKVKRVVKKKVVHSTGVEEPGE